MVISFAFASQEIIWRLLVIVTVNVLLLVLPMFLGVTFPTISTVPHTLLSLPLGLLLVFRTNSAYVCVLQIFLI